MLGAARSSSICAISTCRVTLLRTVLPTSASGEAEGLSASVEIVQANDVIIAQIAPDLHLDQFERDLAGVGEAMNAPDRDVDRFIFVHAAHVVAERDLGRSPHHNPMFGTMEMLLQRELAPRLHDNAFDAIARGAIDILVVAPWAVNATMLDRRAMVVRLEPLDECLHLLGLRARADQYGVPRGYYDHVVEPNDRGEHRFLRTHQVVVAVEHDEGAVRRVASGIVIENVPHRAPAADIRPAQVGRDYGCELGALHDRIVDRLLGRTREGLAREPQEVEVAREAANCGSRRLGHGRFKPLDLRAHGGGVE